MYHHFQENRGPMHERDNMPFKTSVPAILYLSFLFPIRPLDASDAARVVVPLALVAEGLLDPSAQGVRIGRQYHMEFGLVGRTHRNPSSCRRDQPS